MCVATNGLKIHNNHTGDEYSRDRVWKSVQLRDQTTLDATVPQIWVVAVCIRTMCIIHCHYPRLGT